MSAEKKLLVLAFYADGPYWEDVVHLVGLPSGVSYRWPFRYAEKYVGTGARKLLSDEGESKHHEHWEVIVGARFIADRDSHLFLPLRRARIRAHRSRKNLYTFWFTVGELWPVGDITKPSEQAVPLPSGVRGKLCFTVRPADVEPSSAETEEVAKWQALVSALEHPVQGDGDDVSQWRTLTSALCKEGDIKINDNAVHAVFYRLSQPCFERTLFGSGCVAASLLRKSTLSAPVYGFELKQGRDYEVVLQYAVPSLEGKRTTADRIPITFASSRNMLTIGPTQEPLVGNYGEQSIYMSVAEPDGGLDQLLLQGAGEGLTDQGGEHKLRVVSTSFPVKPSWSFWVALRTRVLPLFGLWFGLSILGLVSILKGIVEAQLKGDLDLIARITDPGGDAAAARRGGGLAVVQPDCRLRDLHRACRLHPDPATDHAHRHRYPSRGPAPHGRGRR